MREFVSQRGSVLVDGAAFDHFRTRGCAVPPTEDPPIWRANALSLRDYGVEMFEQLSLRLKHPGFLLQRLSHMLDPFCKRYEHLSEVRIDLFEASIRIAEHATQRFRDLVNTIPITLNRVCGGWRAERFGPSVERVRNDFHLAEEDRVLHQWRRLGYWCRGARVDRRCLRISCPVISSIAVVIGPMTYA